MELYEFLKRIYADKKHMRCRLPEVSTELSAKDTEVYKLLSNISSLYKDPGDPNSNYEPGIIMDGKRSFAIEDLTDGDKKLLQNLDYDKIPTQLSAKVCDVIWTVTGDYTYAIKAAQYFLQLFKQAYDVELWTNCIAAVRQAISLSKKVNDQNIAENAFREIYDCLIEVDGTDSRYFTIKLLEILCEYQYGTKEKKGKYLYLIDRVIQNTIVGKPINMSKARSAYCLKKKLLKLCGKSNDISATEIEYADLLVRESGGAYRNISHIFQTEKQLTEAVRIYLENKQTEKADKAHKKLIEVQSNIPNFMHTFSQKIDITPVYKYLKDALKGLSFKEKLVYLITVTPFNDIENVKKQTINGSKDFLGSRLFSSRFIDSTGKTVIDLPPLDSTDPEKLKLHMLHSAAETNEIIGGTALNIILKEIQKEDFSEPDIQFVIDSNCMIPKNREETWRKGLYLGIKGDYYLATQLLCPQVEHFFRCVAENSDDIVTTLENDGSSQYKVLSSVFDLPNLNECYDPNILFTFKGLLSEKAGSNLRNLVAHGILNESDMNSGVSIYFICATLKLIAQTSPKCWEILNTSERLQQSLKLKYSKQ